MVDTVILASVPKDIDLEKMESLVKMLMNAKKVSRDALTSAQILKEVIPVHV
jgi:hypothetical protein